MSRSIAKALRHGKLSDYRNSPREFVMFKQSVRNLDKTVKNCLRERNQNDKV